MRNKAYFVILNKGLAFTTERKQTPNPNTKLTTNHKHLNDTNEPEINSVTLYLKKQKSI